MVISQFVDEVVFNVECKVFGKEYIKLMLTENILIKCNCESKVETLQKESDSYKFPIES